MLIAVKRLLSCSALTLAVSLGLVCSASAADPPPKSLEELEAVFMDWQHAQQEYLKALQNAKTRADRDKVQAPSPVPFAERCLRVAEKYPGTLAELTGLWWAVCHVPDAPAGKKAYDKLARERIAAADLGQLATALEWVSDRVEYSKARGLAAIVLDRVQKSPDHPRAASLLNWVCSVCWDQLDRQDPPPLFQKAADLIVARYASSPDITNFCECLGMGAGSPSWAGRYEKHLRTILKKNRDRRVRGGALFALASVVHFTGGESRQEEADKLYQQYLRDFDGSDPELAGVENMLRASAKAALEELRWRAVGKPAPEIAGKDLEGRPLKLSQHRGKVVLLSFWATWCIPCMKLLPHERALVKRLHGKPFVLLGVNCDTDEKSLKEALVKEKITWRSFQNKRGNQPTIASAWNVIGFPTLYLIDAKGIIRKRWVGVPPVEELGRAVDEQVEAAEREDKPRTGLIDKLDRSLDGRESKSMLLLQKARGPLGRLTHG